MGNLLVTACNLAYAPGAKGLLRSLREFHPEVRAICLAPSEDVQALQHELGTLAEVRAIPRVLCGIPNQVLHQLMTARVFIGTFSGDSVVWADSDIVFAAPAPELWQIPPGKANVVSDPGYNLGEMVPEDAHPLFFRPPFSHAPNARALNSGVFAIRPVDWPDLPERFERELEAIGYPYFPVYFDQPVFNRIFLPHANWLPLAFNATATNEVGIPPNVRLVHFTNLPGKPWKAGFPRYEAAYYYWVRYGEQERNRLRLAAIWALILAYKPVKLLKRLIRKVKFLLGGLKNDKVKENVGIFASVKPEATDTAAEDSASKH